MIRKLVAQRVLDQRQHRTRINSIPQVTKNNNNNIIKRYQVIVKKIVRANGTIRNRRPREAKKPMPTTVRTTTRTAMSNTTDRACIVDNKTKTKTSLQLVVSIRRCRLHKNEKNFLRMMKKVRLTISGCKY